MANPAFSDRQRRRFSVWGAPRFLHSLVETLDGGLMLPRGLAGLPPRALVMVLGAQAQREVLRSRHRVLAAMRTQVREQGRYLGGKSMRATRPTGSGEKRRYLLSGLVRCARCGRRLDSTWVHGRAAYRCRHGHNSARPPAPDRWKIVYVREDVLVRELLNRPLPGQEVADDGTASDMVTKLRSGGTLITHDGTNWDLTDA